MPAEMNRAVTAFDDPRTSRARERVLLALLMALPLVLLAANRSWIWDNPSFEDWSTYVGFFRHYLEFKWPFVANYKSSRLPWVLPGLALYRWLPVTLAHHLLYLSFLTAETTLTYALLKRRFGQHAAFVVAAAVATSTFSHRVPAYHTQAASTYLVAAMALLELPRRCGRLTRAALGGAALSLALTTDLAIAPIVPAFLLHAIALVPAPRRPARLALTALAGLAGAVCTWAILGLINLALGGPFLFFYEQIRYSIALSARVKLSAAGVGGIAERLWAYPGLTMLILTAVAAVAFLAVRVAGRWVPRGSSDRRPLLGRRLDWSDLEVFAYLISFGGAVLMEARGLGVLEYESLIHPFRVPMYLALGAMTGKAPSASDQPLSPSRAALYAALFLAPLVFLGAPVSRLVLRAARAWPSAAAGVPFAVAIASVAAIVALAARRRPQVRALALAGGLSAINVVCTDVSQPAYMYQVGDTCPFRGETFQALIEADDVLSTFDPENIALWKSGWTKAAFEPAFDGKGWCTDLPIDISARAALLARYFYTSDGLVVLGSDVRPMKKLTLTGTSAAQMEALVADVSTGVPPTMTLSLQVDRRFDHTTFSLFVRGYDIVPRK
jgi:hypothetical protein